MTLQTQDKLQYKLKMLELLQSWLANLTQPSLTYGSDDMYQPKTLREISKALDSKKMTLDSLFEKSSSIACIVDDIYKELPILRSVHESHPIGQLLRHVANHKDQLNVNLLDKLNQLIDTQVEAYKITLGILQSIDVPKTSSKKKNTTCFTRYFCCCFTFYKASKYHSVQSTEGETAGLLNNQKRRPITSTDLSALRSSDTDIVYPDSVSV